MKGQNSPSARIQIGTRVKSPEDSTNGWMKERAQVTQDRDHVRQAERLVAHPYPLRPVRPYLLLKHLHRRYRNLLALNNES
jgi:hypothetical protein